MLEIAVMVLFAVTFTDKVGATERKAHWLELEVALNGREPPGKTYRSMVIGTNQYRSEVAVKVSTEVASDINAFLSIQAAVVAAIRGRERAEPLRNVMLTVNGIGEDAVHGSSLGLAVFVGLLAELLGRRIPDRFVFTGMVTVGVDDSIESTLKEIDSFDIKARAALENGKTIFAPKKNVEAVARALGGTRDICSMVAFDPSSRDPKVVAISRVPEIVQFVECCET